MPFSLEFQPTVADFRQLASDRWSRTTLIVRRAFAACMLLYGLYELSVNGFSWLAPLTVVVAIMIGVPFSSSFLLIWLQLSIWKPILQVTIDDDRICEGAKKRGEETVKQNEEIPWSSFVKYGSATEYKNHFWLESGRGDVWIPKRAFHTDAEIDDFRHFVSTKMGDRCRFEVN